MNKSTLVEILRACHRKELKDIRRWLQSPAHNLRQDVLVLFDYLSANLGTAAENALEKERVWPQIFPGENFDDARFRQVIYFLTKSIEECLVWAEVASDEVKSQTQLINVYRRKNLSKSFRMAIETLKKTHQNFAYRNSQYFLDNYFIDLEQYYFLGSQKTATNLHLQETSDSLDLFFLTHKLRVACHMVSHQTVYSVIQYDTGLLEETLSLVEKRNFLEIPAIAIYYYGYKALTDKDKMEHFERLENTMLANGHLFPLPELKEFYLLALNICINRINAGNASYLRRAYELYRTGFEKDILLENGQISKITFGNAVSFAIRLKEFEWADAFIHKFQHALEEKQRNSMVNFNLSRLNFERGDYTKAQQMLTQFEYDDMLLNIIAKTMLLKIYYEQDELDAFESLLESMRTYLQRKEALDANRKAAYKNLVSLMKKLLHLNPYSKGQIEKLRELVQATNPLMEREWLLRQLEPKK